MHSDLAGLALQGPASSVERAFDIVDLLDRLATACVTLLSVTATGLLLDDQKGNLAVVASSTEERRR